MTTPDRKRPLAALGQGGAEDRLRFRLVLRLLGRCMELLRPVRGHLLGLFGGFSLLAIALIPVGVLLMDAFWTRVLQGQPLTALQAGLLGLDPAVVAGTGPLDPEVRRQVLRRILAVSVGVGLVTVPCGMALYYYQVWILQRVNQLLRIRLLDRLQSLSLRFHSDHRIGDAIYRMYQDSAMVTQLIDVLVLVPAGSIGRFLFCVAVVGAFHPLAGAALLLLWPPLLLLGALFSRRLRGGFRQAREAQSGLTSRIQETLAGIQVIKAYGAESFEQRRFERDSRAAFAEAYSARGALAVFSVSLFWITGMVVVLVSAWAALAAAHGEALPTLLAAGFPIWTLGLFQYFKLRFGDGGASLRTLLKTWGRTQDIAIGLDRVFELLDLEPEVQDAPGALPLERVQQGIRYEGVGFRYQSDRPALEDASFEARVGTLTAVLGPTGSGKTTLMALLLRLFEPDRGRILVDGRDLREIQRDSLRRQVAVALQENLLFGTTIRENIRYAVPRATDAEVREAARVACADEFISALPLGYDTPLGERGAKLSTGQRQRLGIARALLKDPPILILDEPTAALDAETELRLLKNLQQWGRGRLIFLITHRLSNARQADQVLVLGGGRILEAGSPEELLHRERGLYRSLLEADGGAPPRDAAAVGS